MCDSESVTSFFLQYSPPFCRLCVKLVMWKTNVQCMLSYCCVCQSVCVCACCGIIHQPTTQNTQSANNLSIKILTGALFDLLFVLNCAAMQSVRGLSVHAVSKEKKNDYGV